jgi:hypothetical protein
VPTFRAAVSQLASTFEAEAYESAFFDEVEEAWMTTVEPAVQ